VKSQETVEEVDEDDSYDYIPAIGRRKQKEVDSKPAPYSLEDLY
jgi:hypothetical protein